MAPVTKYPAARNRPAAMNVAYRESRRGIQALEDVHGRDAQDGRDEPRHGQQERQGHEVVHRPQRSRERPRKGHRPKGDGRHDGAHVRFEMSAPRPGDVADVVADVVRDDAGIPGSSRGCPRRPCPARSDPTSAVLV